MHRSVAAAAGLSMSFEGNIGVGKSSLLRLVAQELTRNRKVEGKVEVLPEPLDQWQNVDGTGHNLLDAFYSDPKKYAYMFQNFVFLTRFVQHRKGAVEHPTSLRLSERCVFTDRIFASTSIEQGLFSPLESAVYNAWYDPVLESLPSLVPDAFVYLRADPTICHDRIMRRARSEEVGVTLDYLKALHSKHERWFLPDGLDFSGPLFKGHMKGAYSHKVLERRPFLVLDCNAHVKMEESSSTRESLIRHIADFANELRS